jgi:hypothetical protein
MKKILISHSNTIEYSEGQVILNGKEVSDLEGKVPKEYAYDKLRSYYSTYLANHFENLIVLTGSGSSYGIGVDDKKGKTMKELWEIVENNLSKENLYRFCEIVKFPYPEDGKSGDLEALLSRAISAQDFVPYNVESMVNRIQQIIKEECTLTLPQNSYHEIFLKKLTSRKLKYPRLKIFTLNYDTLFEQAASRCGYTIIDGFSYSYPRRFNGKYFDYDIVVRENSRIKTEENYAPRVFHLYKLHGSLDWEREGDYIKKSEYPSNPVIIYPKYSKFESSYEQPFFEMIARFQQSLRKENVFLITIGFSFYDKHISSIIHEALDINNSINILVVTLDIDSNHNLENLRQKAQKNNNVILIEERYTDFVMNYPFVELYGEKDDFFAS